MRHRRAGVHLSRTSAHRQALFSNLVAALFTNERIRTTDAKAKETRRLAERTITWARRVGDVLTKKPDRRTTEESARVVHAVRMARRVVRDRIVKLDQRPGDAASMSLLELMPEDGASAPKPESSKDAPKGKGAAKGETKAAGKGEAKGAKGSKPSAEAVKKAAASKAKSKGEDK
jgi:large subunit ribosomal protein L17